MSYDYIDRMLKSDDLKVPKLKTRNRIRIEEFYVKLVSIHRNAFRAWDRRNDQSPELAQTLTTAKTQLIELVDIFVSYIKRYNHNYTVQEVRNFSVSLKQLSGQLTKCMQNGNPYGQQCTISQFLYYNK